jgi:chitinase
MPSPARRPLSRSPLVIGALALLTAVAGVLVPAPAIQAASPPAPTQDAVAGIVEPQPAARAAVLPALAHSAAAALPNGFKSVGYMPYWSGNLSNIQYSKLTHINYAFVIPNANGTLAAIQNPAKLRSLVSQGHANNVKVLLAVGGWMDGNDSPFETMAAAATTRTAFVTNLINLVRQYNLDGIDIDWEYPNPGTSADNFTLLMKQLSAALHSRGKLLTAAVVSGGATAQGVQPVVFGYVDFLNIMLYDGGSPHANYDWSIAGVSQWKSRGLPAAKAVLGVPFYSRPTYYSYAQLVGMDPANADRDCTTVSGAQQCYNGRPTIRRKTQWAMANAGGMMNWELSQDSNASSSLVSAIYETATGTRSGQITGIAGKCVDVSASQTANGTPIQLWSCNGTNAQRWSLGDGTVRALGKCMDVSAGSTANGAKVQLWDCNGTGAQVWQPQNDTTLRNPQSNKCLDSPNRSTADGTRLMIWDCHGGDNQRWRLPAL